MPLRNASCIWDGEARDSHQVGVIYRLDVPAEALAAHSLVKRSINTIDSLVS